MSGAGNLFTVVDGRIAQLSPERASMLAPILCSPNPIFEHGSEGLLVVREKEGDDEDFRVDFYNPDGSSSMMCGNGARCALRFALDKGFVEQGAPLFRFHMAGSPYRGSVAIHEVRVDFAGPVFENYALELEFMRDDVRLNIIGDYINVGSDHFVFSQQAYAQCCEQADLSQDFIRDAKTIRHHESFERGTNVNVWNHVSKKSFELKTYERGVEAISGACGTGALATALSLHRALSDHPTVLELIPPSSMPLRVELELNAEEKVHAMHLIGPATVVGRELAVINV